MCTSPNEPPRRAPSLMLARAAIAAAALLVPTAAHAQAPPPAAPPTDLATLAPPAPPSGPGVVRLHVESPAPLLILESLGSGSRLVCTSPCDSVVDGSRGQRFTASGPVGATTFQLAGMQGDVDLLVRPGSALRKYLGIAATSLGGTALILSPVAALAAGLSGGIGRNVGSAAASAGVSVGVGGLALLAGGIYLLVTGKTRFDLRASPPAKTGLPGYLLGQF